MYHGHVRFNGQELVNHERLQAYVDHGVVPPGVEVDACDDCDGLAEALNPALVPYRTPLLDLAPWVDLDDPDTFDFTGLLALDFTGLLGSTSTVSVTETLDGGIVTGRRLRSPRQIGATALLTGRTTEGVNAGLRWLTTLLHRTCEDDDCATGAAVEMLTVCPLPLYPAPDFTAAEQLETVLNGWILPTGGWTVGNGDYEQLADSEVGLLSPYPTPGIDGGDPGGTVDPGIDGGSPSGAYILQPTDITLHNDAAGPPDDSTLAGAAPQWFDGDDATYAGVAWNTNAGSGNNDLADATLPASSSAPTAVTDVIVHVRVAVEPHAISTDATLTVELPGMPSSLGIETLIGVPALPLDGTQHSYDASVLDWLTPLVGPAAAVQHVTDIASWLAAGGQQLRASVAGTYGLTDPPGTAQIAELTVELVGPEGDTVDGGGTGPLINEGGYVWSNPRLGVLCGPVTLQWCLTTLDPELSPAHVTLILVNPLTGDVIEYGPQRTIGYVEDCDADPLLWDLPDGIDFDDWAVGFISDNPIANVSVTIRRWPQLSAEECIAPYRRLMPEATVTSGPTVTEQLAIADCATWMKVEWVWTLGSPFKYGTPNLLVDGVQHDPGPDPFIATGVSIDKYGDGNPGEDSTPWNCEPVSDEVTCAVDPCAPGWSAPPAPPVIADPTFVMIGDPGIPVYVRGTSICIDPSATPPGESAFRIRLTSDEQPKVGVRVRIYDQVEGDCTETDKCVWLAEYNIDYIPADGVVTIDGTTGNITTLCPGFAEPQPTPVRGDYGGPIKLPVICGDRRVLIQVQWLQRYPRECEGVYALNIVEGDISVSVDLSTRED